MAGLKKLNTRIINKHATAAVWNDSTFKPLQAEIVIYDPGYDSKDGKTYTCERMKIGDGTHTVQELPFVNSVDVSVETTTATKTVVTNVGSPTYIAASYTAPSMGQTLSNDILTIEFNAGSYTAAQFIEGDHTKEIIEYVTDVSATADQSV